MSRLFFKVFTGSETNSESEKTRTKTQMEQNDEPKGDSDESPRFRFKDISNNYLAEVLKDYRSKFGRAVWLIVFLVMTGFCIYITSLLVSEYRQYDSYNLEFSQLANSYTLPAITICNLNILNYTKLDGTDIYKEYADWINNETGQRDSKSDDTQKNKNEILDSEEIYTTYRMDIKDAVIKELTLFAKEPMDHKEFTSHAYTSSGFCMELNDDEQLVQRVNGAVGGLSLTLDALTEHYMPETQRAGFLVTLRMANETVLSQEFGFMVSPGKEYAINLRTKRITRLEEPWGNCIDKVDHFDKKGYMTMKECYLDQMLWMYPKLRDLGCGCYPWYFYQRYIKDTDDKKYSPDIKWTLMKYWTEDVDEIFRLEFNQTCYYEDTGYNVTTDRISTNTDLKSVKDCADLCDNTVDCLYFQYSGLTNDIMSENECWLYKKTAAIEEIENGVDWKGLQWGSVKCLEMEECTISAETACQNKIMNVLMNSTDDKDSTTEKSTSPPTCHEPCNYRQYEYDFSFSEYPAKRYWETYLSQLESVKSRYDNFEDAKKNLVKLVFYTDQMTKIEVVQTASYEIASFIAELGGLTDLFIGLSFFTCYQFIEWIFTKTARKLTPRRTINTSDDMQMDNARL